MVVRNPQSSPPLNSHPGKTPDVQERKEQNRRKCPGLCEQVTAGSWGRLVPIFSQVCRQAWLFLMLPAWLCFSLCQPLHARGPQVPPPFLQAPSCYSGPVCPSILMAEPSLSLELEQDKRDKALGRKIGCRSCNEFLMMPFLATYTERWS